jgi:membrane carboxypeptidase/penicillin-binding protein PbpC
VEQFKQPSTDRVVEPAANYMLNNVLSDPAPRPVAFGTYAQYLVLPDRPVAAKTGTTNSWVDAWTVGYTPQLAVGVWTGNSDNKPMKLADGSLTSAPIFNAVLKKGMEGLPVQKWQEPPGLERVRVCVPSGLLPTPDCPQTTAELFLAGHTPVQQDTLYQAVENHSQNGRRASVCTPPELIQRVVYQVFPSGAADWVREKGLPQPPTELDGPCGGAEVAGDVAIGNPIIGQRVKAGCRSPGTPAQGFRATGWRLLREGANEVDPDRSGALRADTAGSWSSGIPTGLMACTTCAGGDGNNGAVQADARSWWTTIRLRSRSFIRGTTRSM